MEPRLPAPEDRQPGEGQRLTPDAPHNGRRPPPTGRAPHQARGMQPPQGAQAKGTVLPDSNTRSTWVVDPDSPPGGWVVGGGGAPDLRRPSQWPPTGHASQGDSAEPPHPHTRAHSTWMVDPNGLPGRRAVGGGGAPDLRRPPQRRQAPPPGDVLPPPPQRATQARKGNRPISAGDSYVTATHPALNSACCYTLGGKPPCLK